MASSNKRERELARRHFEDQQRRRAEAQAKTRRRQQIVGGVVALVVVLGGVWWFVRPQSEPVADASGDQSSTTPTPSPSISTAGCTTPVAATDKTDTWKTVQSAAIKPGTTYTITLETNCGNVVIESDPKLTKAAPKTVASQIFLAKHGFFDASSCFRLTTGDMSVLQCGSPTNDGQGGPGYKIPDENLPKAGSGNYPAGTVAMANSGPDTNGSQFFLVYGDTTLGPDYTIWGKVTKGLDVLTKVAEQGVADGSDDGAPAQPLVITKATVSTS